MDIKHRILSLVVIAALLSSCSPAQPRTHEAPQTPWVYTDLRALDASEYPSSPALDVVATYTRETTQEFQVRLDFLDLETTPAQDVYILIDTQPGGALRLPNGLSDETVEIAWDFCLSLLADGNLYALDDRGQTVENLRGRAMRDPFLDTITIKVSRAAFARGPGSWKMQALVAPPGQSKIADRTSVFSTEQVWPYRASVVLAFWNTFRSETPAQALRSWDGAHSGPLSSRHGLRNLIEAAAATKTPLILFDLRTPSNLSALDYLGALPRIRELAQNGLLLLPVPDLLTEMMATQDAPLPFYPTDEVLWRISTDGREVGEVFGLVVFSGLDWLMLLSGIGYTQKPRSYSQATPTGPSLEARRDLLENALQDGNHPVFLGGDFAQSTWGEPDVAEITLRYLAAHPWVRVLSAVDLLSLYPETTRPAARPNITAIPLYTTLGERLPSGLDSVQIHDEMLKALEAAPDNAISRAAWQMYRSLIWPAKPERYMLAANYLGQIGHLIAAAEWANAPYQATDCNRDLDWDGLTECVLAAHNAFATIEPEGGYVAFAFLSNQGDVHQIIGPSSQFALGLSDASLWAEQRGLLNDPAQILGALADPPQDWHCYEPEVSRPGQVILSVSDLAMRKSFEIFPNGIRLTIQDGASSVASVPLVLNPWQRFTPNWQSGYVFAQPGESLAVWGNRETPRLEISADVDFQVNRFNASYEAMRFPEDPNRDYTAGHFLPFPMATIVLFVRGEASLEIRLSP